MSLLSKTNKVDEKRFHTMHTKFNIAMLNVFRKVQTQIDPFPELLVS